MAIFTILYDNYYPPHGYFKLICIGKLARRTWVNLTQRYGQNRQTRQQIVYFDTRGQNEQWANRPYGLMYRTIFFFTNSCEPELAHRLQTWKMCRNSTSLDSCQHDDIIIVTVNVARRRWTALLKPRRPCVKHFTTFYALLKHVSPKGDYFIPKGDFLRPRAIILRTGVRRGHFRCL